jgi:hypothetical protein
VYRIMCYTWMTKKCDMISKYNSISNLILHQNFDYQSPFNFVFSFCHVLPLVANTSKIPKLPIHEHLVGGFKFIKVSLSW